MLDFLIEPRIYKTLIEPRTDKGGQKVIYNVNSDVEIQSFYYDYLF